MVRSRFRSLVVPRLLDKTVTHHNTHDDDSRLDDDDVVRVCARHQEGHSTAISSQSTPRCIQGTPNSICCAPGGPSKRFDCDTSDHRWWPITFNTGKRTRHHFTTRASLAPHPHHAGPAEGHLRARRPPQAHEGPDRARRGSGGGGLDAAGQSSADGCVHRCIDRSIDRPGRVAS